MITSSACQPWPPDQPGQAGIVVALGSYTTIRDTTKRIRRWEHETVLDRVQARLEAMPEAMDIRRCTVEHVFATLKQGMGATHFRTRGLRNVAAEASLAILAYNMKRAIAVVGVAPILRAIRA